MALLLLNKPIHRVVSLIFSLLYTNTLKPPKQTYVPILLCTFSRSFYSHIRYDSSKKRPNSLARLSLTIMMTTSSTADSYVCICVTLCKSFQSVVLLRSAGECAILNTYSKRIIHTIRRHRHRCRCRYCCYFSSFNFGSSVTHKEREREIERIQCVQLTMYRNCVNVFVCSTLWRSNTLLDKAVTIWFFPSTKLCYAILIKTFIFVHLHTPHRGRE